MEVILLQKIQNLGNLGDKVKVAGGYGRNFLLRQGKAVPATKANIEDFESRRASLEKALAETQAQAKARCEALASCRVTIEANASSEGKLFGSVGTREIAQAITATGNAVEKREVSLPDGSIHELGEHTVTLQLHADVSIDITVEVVAQQA